MLSLKDRINLLEQDMTAEPPRISVYHDLPFAILRYDPEEEFSVRHQARLLEARLAKRGKNVVTISLSELLWKGIQESEGVDALVELERERGFEEAQEQVTTYLTDPDFRPLPDLLLERLAPLDSTKDIAFIIHASAMAPAIYHMSRLLDELHGRTDIMTILFYPGTLEGTTGLSFMGLKEREAFGNYRVKIYG